MYYPITNIKILNAGKKEKSPHKYHEVNVGPDTCIYCGSRTRAGGSCSKSPTRSHVTGH